MKKSGSRAYNVWTAKEEDALRAGVRRYGIGAWELIRQDKDFMVVKKRSGVQLKDKWRNLVKFRKLNEEELKNLPTRASGPWSRRSAMRRLPESNTAGGSGGGAATGQTDGRKDRAAAEDHRNVASAGDNKTNADEAGGHSEERRTERPCNCGPRRFDQFFSVLDGRNDGGQSRSQLKCTQHQNNQYHQQHHHQNYQKRQVPSVRVWTPKAPKPLQTQPQKQFQQQQQQQSLSLSQPRKTRDGARKPLTRVEDRRFGIYDIRRYIQHFDNETRQSSNNNDSDTVTNEKNEDSYIVECPCGVKYDDGQMMIECEICKVWAHVKCLRAQMKTHPMQYQYDFRTYHCWKCQSRSPVTPQSQNGSAADQGSTVSDEDVWHPLAGFDVPRKKRFPRKRRVNMRHWCSWMLPMKQVSIPRDNGGDQRVKLQEQERITGVKRQNCEDSCEIGNGLGGMLGLGGAGGFSTSVYRPGEVYGLGGLGMLQAQLLAASGNFRLLPQNLATTFASALYALGQYGHEMPVALPVPQLSPGLPQAMAHLAQHMGFLPPSNQSSVVPPGLVPRTQPTKKMKLEHSISEIGVAFQGATEAHVHHRAEG